MIADWPAMLTEEFRYVVAAVVLVVGLVAGYLVARVNRRLLETAGVSEAIEGTSVERTARNLGTSTVAILARATAWLIYVVSIVVALQISGLVDAMVLWARVANVLPAVVVAVVVFVVGVLAADKAELVVSERLRGVKVPEISVIPLVVKYSIIYVAALIALGQLGVAVEALLVLFGAYAFALVVFTVVATHHLLASGAAGIYLLLNQPYGIGDEVEIGDRQGIVQEVDVFVTRVEDDGREHIVPNHLVLKQGAVLIRG